MTIDQRLREAAQDAHRAARAMPKRKVSNSRRSRRIWYAFASFVLVMVVAAPLILLQGDSGAGPLAPGPDDRNVDSSEVQPEVLAYWSLEGTLESIADEPGWLCPPAISVGYTSRVDASAIPSNLNYELPGQDPFDTYLRDDGPSCSQPPGIVMLAFTDDSQSDAFAGMTVWPSTTRLEDTCPPASCGFDEDASLEKLTINSQPATLAARGDSQRLWWVDQGGVPLYAEASGLSRTELLALAESLKADPTTHIIGISGDMPGEMQIVEQQESVGVWVPGYSRTDVYTIGGASIAIQTRYDSGQTPLSRYATNVSFLNLTDVNEAPAVWIPEGGNFLMFEGSEGVALQVEGATTLEQAKEVAEGLQRSSAE